MKILSDSLMKRLAKNSFLVVGRTGMDLYAEPPGTRIEEASQFYAALGGSAANSAAAISRLDGSSALLTSISDDAVGRFVLAQMAKYGIDGTHVLKISGESRTSLAVVETRSQNCQSVIYRNNAADFQMTESQTGKVDLSLYGALIVTGTCLAMEPSRAATLALMKRARAAELPVIIDLDYRPYSWPSRQEAMRICRQAADLCDIIIGNDEEFDLLAGETGAGLALAKAYGEKAVAVHKMGERGSITFCGGQEGGKEGGKVGGHEIETPIFKVTALKPTGAGDAFLGGFCTSLATGHTLIDSLKRGSANAALVVTRVGCAPASPTTAELNQFLFERSAN